MDTYNYELDKVRVNSGESVGNTRSHTLLREIYQSVPPWIFPP